MAVDEGEAARELADLGQKLSRSLIDDGRDMTKAVALADGDGAGQHHEHAGTDCAGFKQGFAIPVASRHPEPAHALDFLRRQDREGLLVTRKRVSIDAGGRSGRDICTHCRRPKTETEQCRERARTT